MPQVPTVLGGGEQSQNLGEAQKVPLQSLLGSQLKIISADWGTVPSLSMSIAILRRDNLGNYSCKNAWPGHSGKAKAR